MKFNDLISQEESVLSILKVLDNPQKYISNYKETIKSVLDNEATAHVLQKLFIYEENTFRHSVNVAMIAGAILYDSKITDVKLKDVVMAGLFHDIGKQNIDKEILLSDKKLTKDERKIVKLHPNLGYNIASKLRLSGASKKGILAHHEDFDGKGYPLSQGRQEIPVIGRILRVADVYDAIISKRSYKEAKPPIEAVTYILDNIDTLFDEQFISTIRKVGHNEVKENSGSN